MIAATGILASVQFAKLALTVWKGRRAKPVKKFPGKGQRVGRSGFRCATMPERARRGRDMA
eukprot:scaffold625_cov420-Prasinococcus_capsulatus_cf.AAC.6